MRDRSMMVIPESGPACGMHLVLFLARRAVNSPGRAAGQSNTEHRPRPANPTAPSGRLRYDDPELIGQPDQLRHPCGLHLSHYLAAMHLDRHLADPEFAGDLLVEAAGDDQRHDLTLAR